MKIKSIAALLLLTVSSACAQTEYKANDFIAYGYFALESAILISVDTSNPPNDASGLLILLSEIDSDESRELLVKLSNYYLGSATSEAMAYSIVRQGKKILIALKAELNNPINCIEKGLSTVNRCLTVKERNQQIERYIKLIESEQKIEYVM